LLTFDTDAYRLIFPDDRPFIYVNTPEGERLVELFALSAVNATHGCDDTLRIGAWKKDALPSGETVFSLEADSAVWQKKIYRLYCAPHRLRYEIEVEGSGEIEEVNYFGGCYSGNIRWGSGFFWSGQWFLNGFNPEPSKQEQYYFPASAGSEINMTGVPLPGKADWFFTPPPFCFAMQAASGWVGLGVEARSGENRYSTFRYSGMNEAFYLRLTYDGQTSVEGRRVIPAIGFDFAADPYAALLAHVSALREQGYVPEPAASEKPEWWHRPIFCGWGAQCEVAAREKGRAPDFSQQWRYEGFLQVLESHGLQPGTVVLDDKWQSSYGDNYVDVNKWPELNGFIERQHAAGRKVLLWLKAWDPEGLPAEECITNAAGMPVAFDPTNPAFQRRLRRSVRQMLSPDGYNADGFKIDFTARIPTGPRINAYGNAWGLELMKLYLRILYTEAKLVKPDALVMTHTPHPYLADSLDMIRLNDINTDHPLNPAMIHRARVAAIACPGAVIDTDNWPMPNKTSWRDYLRIQADLGVPSLYFTTGIDSTGETLDAEDYRLIQETWQNAAERKDGLDWKL
jgi:hypothetical protein